MRSVVTEAMAVLLGVPAVSETESAETKTEWNGFRQQVSQCQLNNRTAWISLTTGCAIKAVFLRASNDGLVVKANRKTKQWTTGKGEAMVPRGLVTGVKLTGKVSQGGLIGGLAGMGAGAGVTAAGAMSGGACEGSACGGALLIIPVLAAAGYFIGHAISGSRLSYVIEQ
jgi:hypothetical protein